MNKCVKRVFFFWFDLISVLVILECVTMINVLGCLFCVTKMNCVFEAHVCVLCSTLFPQDLYLIEHLKRDPKTNDLADNREP